MSDGVITMQMYLDVLPTVKQYDMSYEIITKE